MLNPKKIRPFIGSQNFETSSEFYKTLGFTEVKLSVGFSLFTWKEIGFYLQAAYVKDWIDNTMVFVEVEDVDAFFKHLSSLNITAQYPTARLLPVKQQDWGKECFVHDPAGILWHFGEFAAAK